jgi:alanine racemase
MLADLPPTPKPPLRLRFDADALVQNWRTLDGLSGAASAGAAVKADGYGTGACRAVSALSGAGVRDFFVAHWAEAAEILPLTDPSSIAVLHGPLDLAEACWARDTGVRPVLNSLPQVQAWLDAGGGACHLMVDTGINRLGLPMDMLGDDRIARLDIDVLISHLASAEEEAALNEVQRRRWDQARAMLPHRRASLANSAGITLGSAYHGDLTRPGIALYGGVPCAALVGQIRPVIHPECAILQVRTLSPGDSVGYNATFTAQAPMRVGVIALGYADGYLRCWSGKGAAQCGDAVLPVLGRVSMDMTVIDLAAAPGLGEGDWVGVNYDLPASAAATGLSQYELLTVLARRFTR